MASEHSDSRFDEGSRDGAGLFTAHDDGLYDQDESSAGERYDLGTGKPINNSTHGYDNLDSLSDDEAGELGFTVIDGYYDEDPETTELVDQWLEETGRELAKAAGLHEPYSDEDIA